MDDRSSSRWSPQPVALIPKSIEYHLSETAVPSRLPRASDWGQSLYTALDHSRSRIIRVADVGRTIAIGDVHGCSKALRTLLEEIQPSGDDTLVVLGDYVDRGPDVRGVVDQLIEVADRCNLIALRGNHEVMLTSVCELNMAPDHWLQSGGQATIASYGGRIDRIPDKHRNFFRSLRPFHETANEIFVHAGYTPDLAMHQQTAQSLYWDHLTAQPPAPHVSGKTVFVGHTPQGSGNPLDWGHLVCLDTYCFGGLWLTALDVNSREIWQASYHGHLRRRPFQRLAEFCKLLWPQRR